MGRGQCYVQLTSSLYFQPNQKATNNFNAVDLLWLRHIFDPLKVLRHGLYSWKTLPRLMMTVVTPGATYTSLLLWRVLQ